MTSLSWGDWLLLVLLLLPVAATLLSFSKSDHWTLRIFDFPRVQIAVLALLCVGLGLFLRSGSLPFAVLTAANLLCGLWQFYQISAYTPLRKPQVTRYRGAENERTVSILTSNVLTPNRRADKLLKLIYRYQPDIILTLESDDWWQEKLAGLEQSHPWFVRVPLDNLYGMHLYSRLRLSDAQVHYRVREDIPSIQAKVQLKSGEWFDIYCLHPMPPSPTEAEHATERDGELLLVGKEIAAGDKTCMVFGDLNDVAWSDTSRLFQRISGLLDPRVGRGLYNTFHAGYWWLRWPLDHIFHSSDFQVCELKVLPHIGSDHFPVYGRFQYCPQAPQWQEAEAADAADKQEAEEKIAAAEPVLQKEREKY